MQTTETNNANSQMLPGETKTKISTASMARPTAIAFIDEDYITKPEQQKFQAIIDNATDGLIDFYKALLRRQSKDNILTIAKYITAINEEINPSLIYRREQLAVLCYFSKFHNQKSLHYITREDVLEYLNSLRKTEEIDPLHKWIGTYNLRRIYFLRFFKWLYSPNTEPAKRPIPEVVKNIPQFKRKEKSIYKPTDLWSTEDDILFFKYCPNKRDICYHAISRDLSCRPHEILNLRIKDIAFKTTDNYQYAEVLVNGKTGNRPIPLISSIPYLKDWLDQHPQRCNPSAYLIASFDRRHKRIGKRMKIVSLSSIYWKYKHDYFPELLERPGISPEDKQKIKELLKKPWNPYIRRHSALTEKSTILKEHVLRQHAGWAIGSQMPQKYLHYFGNESSESLLEAYGIMPKGQKIDQLKPKQCPNCSEPNKPDSRFCAKCRMVLTYDAYEETLENQKGKDEQINILIKKQEQFEQLIQSLIDSGQLKPTIKT